MKKYEVIVTYLAKKDIKNIHSYISNELFLPNEALNLVKLIERNIKNLEVMPERFRKYEKYKEKNIRICRLKKYLIFYNINDDENQVEVVRILYSARNYDSIL
ncbi:hypothetical protein PEPTYR26121_01202 [Peptoniphilus tyrrelliae]|nr:hypothetical protein PEPTYR26121_01202 [Peptoniphilus tyrrelliae]